MTVEVGRSSWREVRFVTLPGWREGVASRDHWATQVSTAVRVAEHEKDWAKVNMGRAG